VSRRARRQGFGREAAEEEVDLTKLPQGVGDKLRGGRVKDVMGDGESALPDSGRLTVKLDALAGKTLVLRPAAK
jgi:hypothetical protein